MIARYAGALGISIVITFALFFLMQFLVARGENPLTDDDSVGRIDITMQDREEDVREKDRDKPERQDVSQPPPPEMQQVQNTRPRASNVGSRIGSFDTNVALGDMEIGAAPSDRDVQPIVRIPPQYPRRAAERGLEGYVDLRFSISKTGSPYNVEVVYTTSSLFNSSAIRAVEKWKYNPKIVDGAPMERHGVEVRISFELEN